VSYFPLPQVTTTAALDATGQNTGNLTNAFSGTQLPRVAWYEVYHAVVTNIPAGAQATIKIGAKLWGFTYPLGGSEWDPSQPMLVQNGQEIYFLWSQSATAPPSLPVVTLWLRYDPALPGNPPHPGVQL